MTRRWLAYFLSLIIGMGIAIFLLSTFTTLHPFVILACALALVALLNLFLSHTGPFAQPAGTRAVIRGIALSSFCYVGGLYLIAVSMEKYRLYALILLFAGIAISRFVVKRVIRLQRD